MASRLGWVRQGQCGWTAEHRRRVRLAVAADFTHLSWDSVSQAVMHTAKNVVLDRARSSACVYVIDNVANTFGNPRQRGPASPRRPQWLLAHARDGHRFENVVRYLHSLELCMVLVQTRVVTLRNKSYTKQ